MHRKLFVKNYVIVYHLAGNRECVQPYKFYTKSLKKIDIGLHSCMYFYFKACLKCEVALFVSNRNFFLNICMIYSWSLSQFSSFIFHETWGFLQHYQLIYKFLLFSSFISGISSFFSGDWIRFQALVLVS